MKYTKYISSVINQFGSINLQQEALRTVLNVIHFEAELKVYQSLNQEGNRNLVKIHQIKQTIHSLTAGLEPKIFMEKLHNGEILKPTGKSYIDGTKSWDEHDIYMTDNKKKQ
jgi:hypothetical protein